jgi:sugar/nucleoside kinase (ribokinase family)
VIDTNGAGDGLAVGFLSGYVLDGFRWKIRSGADKSLRATPVHRRQVRRT